MSSFPNCTVCKKPFKWKGPDPFLLPCLHAVCETCLKSAETSLQCNTCQRVVDLKKTTLQEDRVRQRVILHLTAKHRPTEILCTHEDDGNQAVCWCQDCEKFLCENCQNTHERFKSMSHHAICGINDIGDSEKEEFSYCTTHKRYVLELFDHDCNVLICLKCKQGEHAEHSTQDIDTLTKTAMDELQNHVKVLSDVERKTQKHLDEYNQHALQLDEASASQKDKITHTFDTLKGLVVQREKEIQLDFDTHLTNAKTTNSKQTSALSLDHHVCSNILEYTKDALDHASKTDLQAITGTIRETAEEFLRSSLHERKQEHPMISYQTDDLLELKATISKFSGISFTGQVLPNPCSRLSYEQLRQKCESLEEEVKAKQDSMRATVKEEEKQKRRCEGLETEVTTLKGTITDLRAQLLELQKVTNFVFRALDGKKDDVCQGVPEDPGFISTASFYLLTPKAEPISLHCIDMKFSHEEVNTDWVHINREGKLSNKPDTSPLPKTSIRLKQYRGTCGTSPLSGNSYAQYLELITGVRFEKKLPETRLILEIGLCCKEVGDNSHFIGNECHSYSMHVAHCFEHRSMCRSVRKEGKEISCLPDTVQNTPETKATLHYGVVFDHSRRRIGFMDLKEDKLISVLVDVDTSKPLWPMFGVYNSEWLTVDMELLSGENVCMTETKKTLIHEALSSYLKH